MTSIVTACSCSSALPKFRPLVCEPNNNVFACKTSNSDKSVTEVVAPDRFSNEILFALAAAKMLPTVLAKSPAKEITGDTKPRLVSTRYAALTSELETKLPSTKLVFSFGLAEIVFCQARSSKLALVAKSLGSGFETETFLLKLNCGISREVATTLAINALAFSSLFGSVV